MEGAPRSTRIEIPRWVQLVGLPLLLLLIWVVAGAVRHVLFLFLVALLIALLLNPVVRGLGRAWIPRRAAIALVSLTFAAADALTKPSCRRFLHRRLRTPAALRTRARSRALPVVAQPEPPERRPRPKA